MRLLNPFTPCKMTTAVHIALFIWRWHHNNCFTLSPSALTVENILTAVQGVPWRRLGGQLIFAVPPWLDVQLYTLGNYPKLDEIERQHQSDDSRLRAVIECWLQGEGKDEEPSWRRIIWTLDSTNETSRAADTIRHFAEPLPGKSCDSITFVLPTLSDSVHANSRYL